jgi:hypothetical protein
MLLACFAGCASQCQVTSCVHRPLEGNGGLGRVAVYSVVSAKVERTNHGKEAAKIRESLKASLEQIGGTAVVRSEPLPSVYYGRGMPNVHAGFLEDACRRAQAAGADTVCLVHLKDPGGYLTLGLPQLATVGGKCDYDLRLIELRNGQELASSSGSWADRVDMPKVRVWPDQRQLGDAIAQALAPVPADAAAGPKQTLALVSSEPSPVNRGSAK